MAIESKKATKQRLEAKFDQLYAQLNKKQQEAVDSIEGPVMVLAGPGTGKTQVLALRVANILRQTQMDPGNVLCLTFTESGVAEMRQRLASIMGPAAYQVRIHTFHSFCNSVIHEWPEKFSEVRALEVISESARVGLVRELIDGLPGTAVLKPFGQPYLYAGDVMSALQSLKQERVAPEDLLKLVNDQEQLMAQLEAGIDEFVSLKASERIDAHCDAVLAQLDDAGVQGVRGMRERFGERFQQAENKRQLGSARTALKNDVKKWWLDLQRNTPKQRELVQLYQAYQMRLKEEGWYDYEDMIRLVVDRLSEDDDLLAHYQEQFQYVLVDEYQDTNGAQNETVRLLTSWDEQANVFVVGDDQQSIYRFQGASLANVVWFYKHYEQSVRVVVLEETYRSQQMILDGAEGVMSASRESLSEFIPGLTRSLRSQSEAAAVPTAVREYSSVGEEHSGVAEEIVKRIADGVDPAEIAVLYRNNSDAEAVGDALAVRGIAHVIEGGVDVLQQAEIRELEQLWQVIEQPQDSEALLALMHQPWLGLERVDVMRMGAWAGSTQQSIFAVLQSEKELKKAGVEQTEQLRGLVDRLAQWQQMAHTQPVALWLERVGEESGWAASLNERSDPVVALSSARAFLGEIRQLQREERELTAARVRVHLSLLRESGVGLVQKTTGFAGAVRLMTAHRSKGREFDYVYMVGVTDRHWGNVAARGRLSLPVGIVPHAELGAEGRNEDERRLFYVAMTRARKQVVMSWAHASASGRPQVPAMFVHELPGGVVAHERVEVAEPVAVTAALTQRAQVRSEKLTAWLRDLVSRQVLSVTHVNNYLACPRLYYYRNLVRVPAAKTRPLMFGTAIHEALREGLGDKQDLLERYNEAVEREIVSDSERDDMRQVGEEVLTAYFEQYQADWQEALETEYSFRSHNVRLGEVPITGVIDRVESGRLIDFKTGSPDGKSKSMQRGGDYWRQIVFYFLLATHSGRFPHEVHTGVIDFVQRSLRTGKFVRKEIAVADEDMTLVSEEVQQVWKEIQTLAFLDADRACGECEACMVYH